MAGASASLRALDDFITQALDFGRTEFTVRRRSQQSSLRIGRGWFRFAESEALLTAEAAFCLGEVDHSALGECWGEIYADYSGWHISSGFGELIQRSENLIELDAHLALRGWRASFNTDHNRWDLFDTKSRFGVRLLPSPAHQAEWEPTAPLAHFCRWMAEANGLTMVHAASVSHRDKGALLVGNGGAGKSGTTLAAMKHGLSSAGDDYTLIGPGGAEAAYCTVKQSLSGLSRMGLVVNASPNWQGKVVFRPEEVVGNAIARQAPINAILLPKVGADQTSFSAMDASIAFKILTFSTLKQLGSGYASLFQTCGPLVRELPCFQLNLSPDSHEIADTLARFFETLKC